MTDYDRMEIRQHAIARAYQRFNVLFKPADLEQMIHTIQRDARTYFVKKQSNTRAVYYIPYGDTKYKVIYDNSKKEILTFLRDDMLV